MLDQTDIQNLPKITIENLISPYRKIPYTLEYILRKGFERAYVGCDEITIEQVGKTGYGDRDYIVHVTNLRCNTPEFGTGSPSFVINGDIPIHTTAGGKLEWAFGCFDEYLDDQYKSEYWDETQDAKLIIDVNVENNDYEPETMYQSTNWEIDGSRESQTLVELLKEVIARRAFT